MRRTTAFSRLKLALLTAAIVAGVGVGSVIAVGQAVEGDDGAEETAGAGVNLPSLAAGSVCALSAEGGNRDYWHFLTECFRSLRDNWKVGAQGLQPAAAADRVRDVVAANFQRDSVSYRNGANVWRGAEGFAQFTKDAATGRAQGYQVAQVKDLGQPFNAMGQTGLAYFILQFARIADGQSYSLKNQDVAVYRSLGEGMVRTVVAPVGAGGLTDEGPCRVDGQSGCAWFHSITRRDRPAAFGGTLNQDLHALRDLGNIADLYAMDGKRPPFEIESHVAAGLNQLFREEPRAHGGDVPTFRDFQSPPVGTAGVRWLYYGFNRYAPVGEGGYFLNRHGKDCLYQVHVLALMQQVLQRAKAKRTWPADNVLQCDGVLAQTYRATRIRMTVPDPSAWSGPGGPRDTDCGPPQVAAFAKMDREFYRRTFQQCGF